jgi:hypothetical protein
MKQVLGDLGFDIDPCYEWSFEDTYVAADFAYPFLFRSPEGRDVAAVWPTVSFGVWMPTSRKAKATELIHLFRVPLGNDEHTGLSVDGALNFDFKNMITVNVGCGCTFFNKKAFDRFPLKTHPKQIGLYPWLVAMERKLGPTFAAHASMAAVNYIDGLSAYVEYCFTTHKADELTILSADIIQQQALDADMQRAFNEQIQDTTWTTQELFVGFSYQVTQNLELGAALKAHVKGSSVPKVQTLMANMKIVF